ncbi:MAG: hypothetical protein NZ700_10890 [Gemmataceae bacterium]|nr:hypothetical protein [Gemmataceae bacterium]MDW8264702.1 hypothetical protein [Gemmataceae bacterium]
MKTRSCRVAALGLLVAGLTGCQTWVPTTGQTLPSPRYLQHPPQYLPPSPPFPLPRELATMEAQSTAPAPQPPVPMPPPAPLGAGMPR